MTSTVDRRKTIPFGAAHTYIAHIREYPPPPPRDSQMFQSLRLEHEMHDATSDVNVFEY